MPLTIEVWSDFACPWCYVGKQRLERALELFGDDVTVRRRSFELDPSAPHIGPAIAYAERLARKYATSLERAEEMIRTMTAAGAAEGVELRFDRARPGNTFDAHRLMHLAAERGRDAALEARLFRAYLTEGEALGDRETLVRLAAEAGLGQAELPGFLAGDEHAESVRADEAEARERGIGGVPFFLIEGRYGLSGAQPAEVLAEALGTARAG